MQCHGFLSDAQVLIELNQVVKCKEKEFEHWNTTSVSHILIAASGHNGVVCKKVATKVLQRFYDWYEKNKSDNYLPRCGLERMYPKKCFQDILNTIADNPDKTDKDLLELCGKKIEEARKKSKKVTIKDIADSCLSDDTDKTYKTDKTVIRTANSSCYDLSDIHIGNKYVFIGGFIVALGICYSLW